MAKNPSLKDLFGQKNQRNPEASLNIEEEVEKMIAEMKGHPSYSRLRPMYIAIHAVIEEIQNGTTQLSVGKTNGSGAFRQAPVRIRNFHQIFDLESIGGEADDGEAVSSAGAVDGGESGN